MKAVCVLVAGRVQNVWYPAWLGETAEHHGVRGWVRNSRDGRVEAADNLLKCDSVGAKSS